MCTEHCNCNPLKCLDQTKQFQEELKIQCRSLSVQVLTDLLMSTVTSEKPQEHLLKSLDDMELDRPDVELTLP